MIGIELGDFAAEGTVVFRWEFGLDGVAEVVELEFLYGEGGGRGTPTVEIFGVVEALIVIEGLGWVGNVAERAGSHRGLTAAGREDGAVAVSVEVGLAGIVGKERGFELGFDPGFAGGGFSEFGFEAFFLFKSKSGAHLGGDGRERRRGEASGHARLLEVGRDVCRFPHRHDLKFTTLQIPN